MYKMEGLSQLFRTIKVMINGGGRERALRGLLTSKFKGQEERPAGLSNVTTGMTPPSKGKNEILQDNFCLSGIGKAGGH